MKREVDISKGANIEVRESEIKNMILLHDQIFLTK
jgi:hypothetical protein